MIHRLLCLGALLIGACRSPTEIEVTLRTNLPCTGATKWKGVAVYVGKPGEALEKDAPTFDTDQCSAAGLIGSMVVVPSGANDERVGLRVVASTQMEPERCVEAGYEGCIVARRSLRFRPHQTVELDIDLKGNCVGVPCDAESTCEGGICVRVGDVPLTKPQPSAPAPGEKRVRCGDVWCPTEGNVCCLTVSVEEDGGVPMASGECKDPVDCQAPSSVLFCDDGSDCASTTDPRDGTKAMCFVALEGIWNAPSGIRKSSCMFRTDYVGPASSTAATGLILCENQVDCVFQTSAGATTTSQCIPSRGHPSNPLPGYSWCEFDTGAGN